MWFDLIVDFGRLCRMACGYPAQHSEIRQNPKRRKLMRNHMLRSALKLAPSEALECKALIRWLDRAAPHLMYSHLPLNTPTLAKHAKQNYALGVRKGVPDYMITDPNTHRTIWIEMKRRRGATSVVSPEQKRWLRALGKKNAFLCYGRLEAIAVIRREFDL